MRRFVWSLVVLALALPACRIHVGGGRMPSKPRSPVMAEVDAIRELSFPDDQRAAFRRVARRPNLSSDEQVYLLDAVFDELAFPDARVSVTRALIENPAFCPQARVFILDHLDEFVFPGNKQAVLQALDDRTRLDREREGEPEPGTV